MSLINVSDLSFSYEGSCDRVFDHVSFQIDTNWKLGFIGRNGRGKTTFLNLLLGKYAYSGSISCTEVNFEYFPCPVMDNSQNTRDILQKICPKRMSWELERELSLLDVTGEVLERPFGVLSNGEQTKCLLAALFLAPNSFPLIDEPTNHLDEQGREIVKNYLKRKKGFILVSHDRVLLDECTDHILSINRANIEVVQGNYSSWQRNKELQDNFERNQNEKLKKDINRLAAAAVRTADWSDKVEKSKNGTTNSGSKLDKGYVGHKSAKMMQRSKSIENRRQAEITDKSSLLQNLEESDSLQVFPLRYHSSVLVRFDHVNLFYGSSQICRNICFSVSQGDRLAIRGKNGSGKSTILKKICGENISSEGSIQSAAGMKISVVPQDTSFLKGTLSEYAEERQIDDVLLKSMLNKLDLDKKQFGKDMADFSEGQKKKVLIAASLCDQAHLYIWDEPLNYVDILSRIQIENALLTCRPTLIFVEHDSVFTKKIATKILSLDQDI